MAGEPLYTLMKILQNWNIFKGCSEEGGVIFCQEWFVWEAVPNFCNFLK